VEETAGPPPLTKLRLQVHTSDSGARTLAVSFLVNAQQLLLEDFEAAAHDAVLRHAHAAGHVPVGPILIRTEPWYPPKLEPGKTRLVRDFEELALENEALQGNIVEVKADVELGLSLG
jgi:hypothetical protein